MKKFLFILSLSIILGSCDKEPLETDPIEISAEITHVSIFGASDGAIVLTVTGGSGSYSYAWSNGATTANLESIPAGNYTVTVKDTDDKSATHAATVNEPTELVVEFEKTDESAVGAADGSISLTISGGTEPYTILWGHGATTAEIEGLQEGNYSADVSDAAGAIQSVSVDIFAPLTLTLTSQDASGYDEADGQIDLTIQGGQPPYAISWSNGSTSEDLTVVAGFYEVTVDDNLGSRKKNSLTLYEVYDRVSPEADMLENIIRLQQSGIRMIAGDQVVYIDPINLYEGTTGDADIILITHDHSDHFNVAILAQLAHSGTTIIVPPSCYASSNSNIPDAEVWQIAPDSIKTIEDIEIEVVPAYNSNHAAGCVGYILNYSGLRIYHPGDTQRITEMLDFGVDIAMLPMGQTYTFPSIEEAANAARDVGASVVLPIHYGLYEGKAADPWTFKTMLSGEIDVVVKPSITH